MKSVEIFDYYCFGYNYRLLLTVREKATNKQCYEDIDKYMSFIKSLDLKVTLSGIRLKRLAFDIDKLKSLAEDPATASKTVDEGLWGEIIKKLNKVDIILDSELRLKIAYLLEEKRFSSEILLEEIHKLFPSNTFLSLPTVARFDFEESGKCLAFDRYTACVFHALRGTEDVLKFYYEKVLCKAASETSTWGTFETAISKAIAKKTLTPVPDEQLMVNIASLRKYYRNKTQHPQNIYSSDEAHDVFSLCTKTVSELIEDLKKRKLI